MSSRSTTEAPLHTYKVLRRATFNRVYVSVYSVALVAFFYHHLLTLFTPSSLTTTIISILLLLSDLILGFNWACTQGFNIRPIRRQEFPENLENALKCQGIRDLPGVDIFICTADPYKEPPMCTLNTALSVMAYDYPPEKISVYVSDDGGSHLTLFALNEAAKFARHWLPFCRENPNVMDRSPEAHFSNSFLTNESTTSSTAHKLKTMYESMKIKVENAVENGEIMVEDEDLRQVFGKWSPQHHPALIQVLVSSVKDKDIAGELMPNFIYVSRQKTKTEDHHFKAGALNALLRVSATLTNAPILLNLDCDSYSNDPQTLRRAMCYLCDPIIRPTLAYVQFPQIFRGLNQGDIYYGEHKRLYQINPMAMDGLQGPCYVGTGCFFQRRAFFGTPTLFIHPDIPQLSPYFVVNNPIDSPHVLALAHTIAASDYDHRGGWGSKLGFRYGSLSEDFNTGYRLHCMGWKSIFCNPERPAYLGDSPITLIGLLGQNKRWMHGLLDVFLSKYNTITYGVKHLGLLMGLAYTNNPCWPILSIPLTLYAFLPQIALINGIPTFPKVSDPWFLLYMFLCIGGNAKDAVDYVVEKGSIERWWNSQRMWMICGLSSFLFGFVEYILSSLGGIKMRGFNVTSKMQDNEQVRKRYDQGIYEFGVASPMFLPLTMAAILNLASFLAGVFAVFFRGVAQMEGLFLQMLLSAFVTINCWPVYEAMFIRTDKGRMSSKISLIAAFLASLVSIITAALLKM